MKIHQILIVLAIPYMIHRVCKKQDILAKSSEEHFLRSEFLATGKAAKHE